MVGVGHVADEAARYEATEPVGRWLQRSVVFLEQVERGGQANHSQGRRHER